MPHSWTYLFGPVASRRYGASLGVDLTVPKTCTLDCRFCQLGPTPATTCTRIDTPEIGQIIEELQSWIENGGRTDYVTLSGSGEPTLNRGFGTLLRFIRQETTFRSLLLSNGTLFHDPAVRRDAAEADVVKLSLHGWDQASFVAVTRPHPSLLFNDILTGYQTFRRAFKGLIDLEVFVVPGLNDSPEQMARIAACAASFSPDSVTLNTAVRRPADPQITACPPEKLTELHALFAVPERADRASDAGFPPFSPEAVRALHRRHPIPATELARQFGRPAKEIQDILDEDAPDANVDR